MPQGLNMQGSSQWPKRRLALLEVVSVITNDAQSVVGRKAGLVSLFTKCLENQLLGFHCTVRLFV